MAIENIDLSTSSPLEIAKYMVSKYTEAEIALISGSQEYRIADKMYRKADLDAIRSGLSSWRTRLDALDPASAAPKRRVGCYRGVSCR